MGLQSYALHSNLSKWTKGNLLERRAKVQGRQHHRYIYALAIRPWLLFPFLLALHAYSPPSKPRTQVKAACLNSHGYTLAISCAHLHLQRRQLPCALCVGVAAVPAVAVWGGGAQKGWRGRLGVRVGAGGRLQRRAGRQAAGTGTRGAIAKCFAIELPHSQRWPVTCNHGIHARFCLVSPRC